MYVWSLLLEKVLGHPTAVSPLPVQDMNVVPYSVRIREYFKRWPGAMEPLNEQDIEIDWHCKMKPLSPTIYPNHIIPTP